MQLGKVIEAALELQEVLQKENFSFCFIGGLAVQRWGEPRFTKDADATVITRFFEDEKLVDLLLSLFKARKPDSREIALFNRVLLIQATNGTPLDVALGALDFEINSITRASYWSLPDDLKLLTCSAEDLIVHKAFASRDLDWLDIDRILMRQGNKLDVSAIFKELRPLVEIKEDLSILTRLEQLMRKRDLLR
jgi:hypothetical protein